MKRKHGLASWLSAGHVKVPEWGTWLSPSHERKTGWVLGLALAIAVVPEQGPEKAGLNNSSSQSMLRKAKLPKSIAAHVNRRFEPFAPNGEKQTLQQNLKRNLPRPSNPSVN